MAGGNGGKKRKRKRGRRMKRKPGSSPSSSASSDDASPPPVEEERRGGLEVSGGLPDYEFGWHNSLFVGTKGNVDILGSVRNQLLKTCFLCAILYAAEQDIRSWLAIEEPDRQPDIYFDYDTYVTQYETEIKALIGQVQSSVYRTREDRPKTALKIFLRDGVMAYSKSKEWPGGKIIKISDFQLHKDMMFEDFENIIASGGSVIGGFPVSPEFKDLQPDAIYEFSPPGVKRQSMGAHMVQFIGTGADGGREFLVFLNSKKRPRKDGVGKVYFDQIYSGVYTLQCRAPPPPSDETGLIVAGPDDNDGTLGSSGAAPDGNKMSSFFSAPDGNNTSSSTAPTKSLSQVRKCIRYDDDTISSSCTIKIDGWVLSAPTLLVEDIQTRTCASIVKIDGMSKQFEANLPPPPESLFCVATEKPWKKKILGEMATVTRCFVPSNNMNDWHCINVLLKICDKLGGLNSKLALEHRQMIPIVNKIPTLILGRDLSHGSSGLSDIPSSARNQQGRKHKRPISSSGQANSSGTMNTTGPIPSLASSNPFTNTVPMPLMHHNASISSHLAVLGADAAGARESPTDQIVDTYRFRKDDCLGHKVDSFFSRDDFSGPRDARGRCMACTKGFTFREIYSAGASAKKVACFHSLSDGKLLATGGHNMKLGRLPVEPAALRDCSEDVGMLFHSTSPNPNVPYWRPEGVISRAKIEDIKAMAICHKESVTLYANMSLCKLPVGDGEGALSDALRCRLLRPDWAKACYRQAPAHMLLKEYEQARDALLDAQKLDLGMQKLRVNYGRLWNS
ncbi:uncharacterized protein [Lolium perenne]|uniref:uncharacterized protein isoform X2 n=1 Tax=Lolium perenne TaxID=4522 RepID=UPI003A99EC90